MKVYITPSFSSNIGCFQEIGFHLNLCQAVQSLLKACQQNPQRWPFQLGSPPLPSAHQAHSSFPTLHLAKLSHSASSTHSATTLLSCKPAAKRAAALSPTLRMAVMS